MQNCKLLRQLIFAGLFLAFGFGCSTKNDAFINRAFHNTTARYNGYFNAREILKETQKQLTASNKDDFQSILSLYIAPPETPRAKGEMDQIIAKCSDVIQYHSMEIQGEEKNRWIDECYFLIGMAHYHNRNFEEAQKSFAYTAKAYPTKTGYWAKMYEARTELEQGEIKNAGLALSSLEQQKDLPLDLLFEVHLTRAQLELSQENYKEAIPAILSAIRTTKKKKKKARLYFVLAQLYVETGQPNNALKSFAKVGDMSPSYDLEFYSKIYQATAVTGKNNAPRVRADLLKMLNDDKNREYFDQIYYALGEVELKLRDKAKALDYFTLSTQTETRNPPQLTRSFLKIGNIHFDDRDYIGAQVYYDSAVANIPTSFPQKDGILSKKEKLSELVTELRTINRNDSLIALAQLPEEDLQRKLKAIAKEMEAEARKANESVATAVSKHPDIGKSKWHFYNASVRKQGLASFKQQWGDRPLTDFWRLEERNKNNFDNVVDGESVSTTDYSVSIDELKKDIPFDDAIQAGMLSAVEDALFKSGKLFKESFDDLQSSTESFENFISRFPSSDKKLTVYYLLYRNYLEREEGQANFMSFDSKSSSFYYADLITFEFPDSEFAKIINNPQYLEEKKTAGLGDQKKYLSLYKQYLEGNGMLVMDSVALKLKEPSNSLTPKYLFLLARIYSDNLQFEKVIPTLQTLVGGFPKSDEGIEAQRILNVLQGNEEVEEETSALFNLDPNQEHYLLVLLPQNAVGSDKAKAFIGSFNDKFFQNEQLKLSTTFIRNDLPIIMVKKFANQDASLQYYRVFKDKIADFSKDLRDNLPNTFLISRGNFIELFKNKDVESYKSFFQNQYL